MRNFFANYRGGASSRAGLAYVGTCKQAGTANPPRIIPFQFNLNQGYSLEFGDQYMRVIYRGAYIVETAENITAATQATPLVMTIAAHGYSSGDWIYITGMGGMTALNGLVWKVDTVPTANTFTLKDLFGNVVNSVLFNTYTSGGTAQRIYTVTAPYAAIDLPFLKFTQSADTMSLTCVNQDTNTEYPPYDLVRNGNTDWVFTATDFSVSITPPTGVTATPNASTTVDTYYSYVVTAVKRDTGEESVASPPVSAHNNNISLNKGSNDINWLPVEGASSYNIYKATPSFTTQVQAGVSYGFAGSAFGTAFTDNNITQDFTIVPPLHNNPFARGAITGVNVTDGGSSYAQDSAACTITTSTGTDFVGVPVVDSTGAITAVLIENGGEGYVSTNTLAFIASGTSATGTYTFTTNPTNGRTIILNGVTWKFVTAASVGNQTQIKATLALTLTQLAIDLNASVTPAILLATYAASPTVLTITAVATGTAGNSYTIGKGTYRGAISGKTLTGGAGSGGSSATAEITVGAATGTYPGVVAYFQQRRAYANTENKPNTYFFSQPGNFKNFDSAIPTVSDDAIVGAPWAQQVNGIQFMVPMQNGLVTLTGSGAWLLNGGNNTAITPSDQTATAQSYNGCNSHVPPIVVNYDILYVQSKGSIVRDLAYNFITNNYTGTDMTVLSNHLFNYHQIQQWAYAEEPYKVVWCVRDDGILLSLTYLKEQDVYAWARHDTNGFVVSVCSVTEPPVDAVYSVVKRYINGSWMYYTERMDNRNWQTPEDAFCVDAGLRYPMTYPVATLQAALNRGTRNITTVNLVDGGSGYVMPTVAAVDPKGEGTGATFTATVSGGVITSITVVDEGDSYNAQTALVITDSAGSGALAYPIVTNIVTFTASASVFSAGNVGDVIRIGNNNATAQTTGITLSGTGTAVITEYVSATEVTANITNNITAIIPDDPNDTPVPAISGQWSLSTPTASVSGLNHLEGMEVAIVADGSVLANQTVLNGTLTLSDDPIYSAITIGLPYTCQLQTLYLDAQGPVTMQGKRKNIGSVTVRMENSRGMSVGTNQVDQSTVPNGATVEWVNMIPLKNRNALINAGAAIPLYTGDHFLNVGGNWSVKGQIAVEQLYPMPANITAVICEYNLGDSSSP